MSGRLWWEQTAAYWDLPFYSIFGMTELPSREDALAGREQLWAMLHMQDEGDLAAMSPFDKHTMEDVHERINDRTARAY